MIHLAIASFFWWLFSHSSTDWFRTCVFIGPHEQDSDDDDDDFEEVQIQESRSDKKKGKQPKRNFIATEPKKPRNAVFAMQGAEILPGDPTYVGGTRVNPTRLRSESTPAVSADQNSPAVSEASTPPAVEGEESREGTEHTAFRLVNGLMVPGSRCANRATLFYACDQIYWRGHQLYPGMTTWRSGTRRKWRSINRDSSSRTGSSELVMAVTWSLRQR